MDGEFWLNAFMRWLHVASAVVGVGTTVAMRFAVLPALQQLPNAGEVLDAIRRPVKRLIHGAIGVLLLTGLYNYLFVAIPAVRRAREAGIAALEPYHALMGVKILLSLALFTIAILLLAPVPSFHENRRTWLSVNVVLGLVILALAAYLRRLWPVP
jgi:hypothetical protein